jgi:glycosyltransferase involved in cell wall biosynthesis
LDKLLEVDVFFSPNPIFTSVSRHCFYLLTVHDLSFEVFPEFFNTYRRIWHWLVNPRKLTERADKVLAVSHSTKKDLKKIYRVPGKKIKVLYPGISSKIKPSYNKKCLEELFKKRGFVFPDKYFLFLATLEPRKNLISVLLAFDRLWKEGKIDHWLVVAGEEGWLFSETAKVFQSMEFKDKVIFLGGVSEEARKILYSCAQMFIYPSFYEGFGFPPLESLACNGGVVICSSNSSLPEVVGEAALLINPYNPEELAWAMERGVKDWELRKILKEKGKKQSQRFSKSRSAEQFLEQLPNR